jgi:hypothetical protein
MAKLCLLLTHLVQTLVQVCGVFILIESTDPMVARPNANMSFRLFAFRERVGARCPRWGLRPKNSRPTKLRTDRALTKGTTHYSHLPRSMVLSPLERHLNDGA